LANAEIISSSKNSKVDGINYGDEVTLKVEWDKDEYTVKIVWTGEVWIKWKDNLLISLDSPIGISLKWHKVWDVVKMRLGNDRKEVTIVKVD
jgi:transcription elongation GreA/GreB family factor